MMESNISKKVKKLPHNQQQEVEDFIDYLIQKYLSNTRVSEPLSAMRHQNLGRMKGKIWMAEDFNATPEDFKGYL